MKRLCSLLAAAKVCISVQHLPIRGLLFIGSCRMRWPHFTHPIGTELRIIHVLVSLLIRSFQNLGGTPLRHKNSPDVLFTGKNSELRGPRSHWSGPESSCPAPTHSLLPPSGCLGYWLFPKSCSLNATTTHCSTFVLVN